MKRQLSLGAIAIVAIIGSVAGYAVSESSGHTPPPQPAPPGIPPGKAAAWNYVEQQRVAGAGHPATPPTTPTGSLDKHFIHGIFEATQGPFTVGQFFGVNSWASNPDANGLDTVVIAGSQPSGTSDPYHSSHLAAVFVYTDSESSPGPSKAVGIFEPSPDPAGQFTVVSDNGAVLTLSLSGSSAAYYFNVTSRSFQAGS